MISLTIDNLNTMTRADAAALRAIADVYHPVKEKLDLKVTSDNTTPVTGTLGTPVSFNVGALGEVTTPSKVSKVYEAYPVSVRDDPVVSVPQMASEHLGAAFLASAQKTAERVGGVASERIQPDDLPTAGAPDQHALADAVFSGGVANLTSGNAHGSAELDADAAKLEALAGPGSAGMTLADIDPAQVFSGGAGTVVTPPNVHAATPTPPPLPAVTQPTSLPQSPAATNVSPPPPPPPAPGPDAASAAAPTTSPAPVELDASGLPWDARIHASTKTKTAKNVWTRRRGIDDSLVQQVEAQLRAAMGVQAPPAPAPAAWPFPADSSSVTGAAPAPTFPILMTFITERIGDQRLTQDQVSAAVQAVGLESLNLVMARPDLIPAIMTELQKVAP